VFVLAVIAVLTVLWLPLAFKWIELIQIWNANTSLNTLWTAVHSFTSDSCLWPASDGSSPRNQSLKLLFACSEVGSCESKYPDVGTTDWNLTGDDNASPAKNNQNNHLGQNDPNANGTPNDANDYATTGRCKWNGPYLFGLRDDPWGAAFVINIGAFLNSPTNTGKCWLLSAGPDGVLQTSKGDTELSGDDVGFFVC
jgi:type II secretory pathway pseudopilin PulG